MEFELLILLQDLGRSFKGTILHAEKIEGTVGSRGG